MVKKIYVSIILISIIVSSIIIPKIYAENLIVSIPNKTVKAGEQLIKAYINLENANYNISKINMTTNIYLYPVLDAAGIIGITSDFDIGNQTFTITNIPDGVKTLCVLYTIPTYLPNGTIIELSYEVIDDQSQVKEANTVEIIVLSDETNNQNQEQPNDQGNINNTQSQNNGNIRSSKSE